MSKLKDKVCKDSDCNQKFTPYSSFQKYCGYECHAKNKSKKETKKKAISPVSKKRLDELAHYRKVRDKYLKDNPVCEVHDCNNPSDHIHHVNGRTGKRLYDDNYFMAVGGCCHPKKIHENPEWARKNGYLI